MYILKIVCTSLFVTCEQPPLIHPFKSAAECDHALMIVAHQWRPTRGEYTYNCVREDNI